MLEINKVRNPYHTMTTVYGNQIDFNDKRFAFIPGDVNEILGEMERLHPRLNAVALGNCKAQDIIMEFDWIQSRLWHLIDHAKSLDSSIQTLISVIDASDDTPFHPTDGDGV